MKPSNDQNHQITGMELGMVLATTTRDKASAGASLRQERWQMVSTVAIPSGRRSGAAGGREAVAAAAEEEDEGGVCQWIR
jgi:hypothetical protein